MRDLDADRRLPALVLAAIHQCNHARHSGAAVPSFDDLFERPVFFHIGLENGVKYLVGGQRVFILLVGPQLGGRRPI